jgi:type VI secretion system secreted protein Hcp
MDRRRLTAFALSAWLPATAAVLVEPAAGADYFLKVTGVEGESADAKNKGAIDVVSYSWGVTGGGSAGGAPGRPAFQDFRIVKRVDKSSPALFRAAASSTTFPSARLVVRHSGERGFEFLEYCMEQVRVSSVESGGSGAGEATPSERVSFGYGTFSQQYREQRADGSAGPAIFSGFDLRTNALLGGFPPGCGVT